MTEPRRLVPAVLVFLVAGCSSGSGDVTGAWPGESGKAAGSPGARATAGAGTRVSPIAIQEIMAEARKTANIGNHGGAVSLYDEVLKLDPTNREALYMVAAMSQERAGDLERPRSSAYYLRAASAMRRLRATYPKLSDDETAVLQSALYNEARTYAVEDKPQKAVESLAEAVDAGFSLLKTLQTDPELASVRTLPRFQELLKRVERETRALASRAAKGFLAEKPFPFAFKLPAADSGNMVSSEDYRGKVLIADFWGTWCPPCRAEVSHLLELSRKYKDQGLQVVGLNYEHVAEEDVKSTIVEFTKQAGVTYPCLIGDQKTMEQVPKFAGFPTTIFLDRNGKVRARLNGFNPDNSVAIFAIEEIVTTLLAEKP